MLHGILWAIIVLLVVAWLLGLVFRIGCWLIHVLLVIAVIIVALNIISLVFHLF